MVHLFHGEHVAASRRELTQFREKFAKREVVMLDGRTVTTTDLVEATQTASLFGTDRLVIVENLMSRRIGKKNPDGQAFTAIITNLPPETEIVFWEEKEIPKTILTILPKTVDIALFKPDRIIFSFVESLFPGNTREMLAHFEASLKKDTPEMIFAMLVRQFRYLLMVKDLGQNVTELSGWQRSRFLRQTERFTMPQLLDFYRHLLTTDVTIKSGTTPMSLTQELRLFLVSI